MNERLKIIYDEYNLNFHEREIKDNSFKKFQLDYNNDDYMLDNMMNNLSVVDNKPNQNANSYFIDTSHRHIHKY